MQSADEAKYGMNRRVLIVGSGGREHAIAASLSKSISVAAIFVAPGNAGTISTAKTVNVSIQSNDIHGLVNFSKNESIDLVVVGPEQPLGKPL